MLKFYSFIAGQTLERVGLKWGSAMTEGVDVSLDCIEKSLHLVKLLMFPLVDVLTKGGGVCC